MTGSPEPIHRVLRQLNPRRGAPHVWRRKCLRQDGSANLGGSTPSRAGIGRSRTRTPTASCTAAATAALTPVAPCSPVGRRPLVIGPSTVRLAGVARVIASTEPARAEGQCRQCCVRRSGRSLGRCAMRLRIARCCGRGVRRRGCWATIPPRTSDTDVRVFPAGVENAHVVAVGTGSSRESAGGGAPEALVDAAGIADGHSTGYPWSRLTCP